MSHTTLISATKKFLSTHKQPVAIRIRSSLKQRHAQRTQHERVNRPLGRERVLHVVHGHRNLDPMLPRQLAHVQGASRRRRSVPAHHIHVALREADNRDGEPAHYIRLQAGAVDDLIEQIPLLRPPERKPRRVADANTLRASPFSLPDSERELTQDVPHERLGVRVEIVVEVEIKVEVTSARKVEQVVDVLLRSLRVRLDVRGRANNFDAGRVRRVYQPLEVRVRCPGLLKQRILSKCCVYTHTEPTDLDSNTLARQCTTLFHR
jgi:hypothetical protein